MISKLEPKLPNKFIIRMVLTGILIAFIAGEFQLSMIGWIWMSISAFMVMDVRHGLSLRAGLARILCASVGTLIGYLLAVSLASAGVLIWAIGLVVIGYLNALCFFLNPAFRMLGVQCSVVFILSLMPGIELPIWLMAVERTLDTAIAVGVVVLSSMFGLGDYVIDPLQEELQKLLQAYYASVVNLQEFFVGSAAALEAMQARLPKLNKSLHKAESLLVEAYQENEIEVLSRHTCLVQQLRESYIILRSLTQVLQVQEAYHLLQTFNPEIQAVLTRFAAYYHDKLSVFLGQTQESFLVETLVSLAQKLGDLELSFAAYRREIDLSVFSIAALMPMYSLPLYLQQWQKIL